MLQHEKHVENTCTQAVLQPFTVITAQGEERKVNTVQSIKAKLLLLVDFVTGE